MHYVCDLPFYHIFRKSWYVETSADTDRPVNIPSWERNFRGDFGHCLSTLITQIFELKFNMSVIWCVIVTWRNFAFDYPIVQSILINYPTVNIDKIDGCVFDFGALNFAFFAAWNLFCPASVWLISMCVCVLILVATSHCYQPSPAEFNPQSCLIKRKETTRNKLSVLGGEDVGEI